MGTAVLSRVHVRFTVFILERKKGSTISFRV